MRDRERDEQAGFLRGLRRDRAAAFRKEIVPYFRYVFQSGFGLFVSAALFALYLGYTELIRDVPPDWPVKTVGVALLSLAAIRAPLRTYLRPADTVFLLPMEPRVLDAYIRPARTKAIAVAAIRALALFALFAPLYVRAPQTAGLAEARPLALVAILLAIVAGGNVYGGWLERRLADRSWRLAIRLARWGLTIVVVAALLLRPMSLALPFMLLCAAAFALLHRLPTRHALPWERLIDEEAAARRRWTAFLGWFVDVPTESAKPARRSWIAWAGDRLPWSRDRAWHYLYAKAFLRGDTFGALWRWVLLTGFVLALTESALASAIVYGVSVVVIGLQLSELRRIRFVETADTVPLRAEDRYAAAAAIARTAGLASAVALGAAGLAMTRFGSSEAIGSEWLAVIAFGLIWCGWWMPRRIAKSRIDDE
ncbi:ABC transporter permease [Paenibacillaceae bacterium WGS1546]|uniref:ABC transporter permease n=1 Tax=Cohnella sp. WGS1546 TaxID=3366810 RepID=UPI00372D0FE0